MSACRQVTLAQNGIAHVQRCTECDCVSIHLGATTVRLDAAGLDALWSVLGEASAALHVREASRTRFGTQRGLA